MRDAGLHSNKTTTKTSSSSVVIRIHHLHTEKNAQFQKAKRSNQTSHHVQYRRLRNRITNMIRTAKREYFGKLNTFNSKDFCMESLQNN